MDLRLNRQAEHHLKYLTTYIQQCNSEIILILYLYPHIFWFRIQKIIH